VDSWRNWHLFKNIKRLKLPRNSWGTMITFTSKVTDQNYS
jgi:hypothetical protein